MTRVRARSIEATSIAVTKTSGSGLEEPMSSAVVTASRTGPISRSARSRSSSSAGDDVDQRGDQTVAVGRGDEVGRAPGNARAPSISSA